jgi:hypothetical protein
MKTLVVAYLLQNLNHFFGETQSAEFAESVIPEAAIVAILEFATATKKKGSSSTKGKECQKGYPCGKACIARSRNCRNPLVGQAKTYQDWVKLKAQQPAPTAPTASQTPQQKLDDLSKALSTRDFDQAATIANEFYENARKRAPDNATFYTGIQAGNGSVEDWILKELYAARGFDGKPTQVTDQDIENDYNNGATIAYRAMGSSPQRFDQHFNNFKTGDYFAGHGIYGHGTYVAFAGKSTRHTRQMAAKAASGYGNGVMRMTLDPSMKIIKQSAQIKQLRKLEQEFDNWASQLRTQTQGNQQAGREASDKIRRLKAVLFGDSVGQSETSGRLAVIQGYDAIQLDRAYDPTYMNLLNRSKVRVSTTPGKLGQP